MSFIDVAIPAIIGIVVLLWPKVLFVGSRATRPSRSSVGYAALASRFSPLLPYTSSLK
jgi:hypothetical protein